MTAPPRAIARVWRVAKTGSLAALRLAEQPLGALAEGRVRIDVRAVGLNFADVFAVLGLYSATPAVPFIPGLEVCGVVSDGGNSGFAAGTRVMAVTRFGGYASVIDAEARSVAALPDAWSFEEGAAFPVQTLTALYALRDLGAVQAGQCVMVHSAAGGVGLQALAIGTKLGATMLGTVGRPEKVAFLRSRGYSGAAVRGPGVMAALVGDKKLALVLDAVGGEVLKESYRFLAPAGRLVVFGAADFASRGSGVFWPKVVWKYLTRPRIDPLAMVSDNKSVLGFNLIWLWEKEELLAKLWSDVQGLGLDAPYVGEVMRFEEAREGLEKLKGGGTVGKVVLRVSDPL